MSSKDSTVELLEYLEGLFVKFLPYDPKQDFEANQEFFSFFWYLSKYVEGLARKDVELPLKHVLRQRLMKGCEFDDKYVLPKACKAEDFLKAWKPNLFFGTYDKLIRFRKGQFSPDCEENRSRKGFISLAAEFGCILTEYTLVPVDKDILLGLAYTHLGQILSEANRRMVGGLQDKSTEALIQFHKGIMIHKADMDKKDILAYRDLVIWATKNASIIVPSVKKIPDDEFSKLKMTIESRKLDRELEREVFDIEIMGILDEEDDVEEVEYEPIPSCFKGDNIGLPDPGIEPSEDLEMPKEHEALVVDKDLKKEVNRLQGLVDRLQDKLLQEENRSDELQEKIRVMVIQADEVLAREVDRSQRGGIDRSCSHPCQKCLGGNIESQVTVDHVRQALEGAFDRNPGNPLKERCPIRQLARDIKMANEDEHILQILISSNYDDALLTLALESWALASLKYIVASAILPISTIKKILSISEDLSLEERISRSFSAFKIDPNMAENILQMKQKIDLMSIKTISESTGTQAFAAMSQESDLTDLAKIVLDQESAAEKKEEIINLPSETPKPQRPKGKSTNYSVDSQGRKYIVSAVIEDGEVVQKIEYIT